MTITIDENFINYAEEKLSKEILRLSDGSINKIGSKEIARKIVASVDWDNPALMHKGFTWIARNYLSNRIEVNV